MKFRLGACAAVVLLAACSGQKSGSEMAALHGSAGGDTAKAQLRAAASPGRDVRHSIANAPDKGALMSYQNQGKPVKREGAYTYYPVAMSEEHALNGVVTGHMSVPMPDGSQVKLRYERHEENVDGNWTWIGRMEGGEQAQEAVITFGPDAVFASIPRPNAMPLNIQTRDGALWAVDADPSKLTSGNKGHNDMAIAEAAEVRAAAQAQAQSAPVAQGAVAQSAPAGSANTIDVVIGYTPGFRTRYGSASVASTRLVNLIEVGNVALSNSKVNGYLRLVRALEVNYNESNTNQAALYDLTGSTGDTSVTVPAGLVPLRNARDEFGGDVAILMRGFLQPEHQGCGIAWLNGANQRPIDPVADAAWGYGVVSDGNDAGTDGNSYFCAAESLVHEIGHLLGSAHDAANSKNSNGTQLYGRYAYSFGYKTSTNGNFYTIMAYGDENQTPYRVFSHPGTTFCGGQACGIANQSDNARSLNQTIPVVALFRETKVPFIGRAKLDVNADGRSDLLWRYTAGSAGSFKYSLMNGATKGQEKAFTWNAAYQLVASGDFNGDGLLDLIWVLPSTRGSWMWLGKADGTFNGVSMGTYPVGWSIVGAGDINNDGRDDLLWRYQQGTTSYFKYSIMNGATRVSEKNFTWSSAYRLAAVGDFNADGYADIVWEETAARRAFLWLGNSAGTFVGNALGSYPAGWNIVGAGDIDNDGKSDLLWRYIQGTTGYFKYTLMNGATKLSERNFTWNPIYQLAAYGDFNGDGRLDIVWVDPASRGSWMWQGAAGGSFSSTAMGKHPEGWSIVDPGN